MQPRTRAEISSRSADAATTRRKAAGTLQVTVFVFAAVSMKKMAHKS